MRKNILLPVVLLFALCSSAQWKPLALQYKHLKQPGFFVPLAMHFSDTSNGFICTSSLLLQHKDQQWQIVDTGPFEDYSYTNVFTVDSQHTFLCGFDGKFSRFNGQSLEILFQLPPTEFLNPVLTCLYMADSSNGWVAGDAGILIKVENGSFTEYYQQDRFFFKDIFFDHPDHGWLIGYKQDDSGNEGIVLEYKNGRWDEHSHIDEALYDIEVSGGTAFIAGEHDIYRFNLQDDEWQAENIPGYYHQFHISLLNEEYGMSVSDNSSNMLYENGQWSAAPVAPVSDLFSVQLTAAGAGWAISQAGTGNTDNFNEGKIQQLQQNSWNTYPLQHLDTLQLLPVNFAITNIAAVGRQHAWFDGQYVALPEQAPWPDTIPVLNSDSFCMASRMFSKEFGLGISGDLQEWNGLYWVSKNLDTPNPDSSISNIIMHVQDDTTAYVVRQILMWGSGEIKNAISQYDYLTNTIIATEYLDTRAILGIHFLDYRHGWCVGDSGLIAKFVDGHWQLQPPVTEKRLYRVWVTDTAEAWAVGDNGTLLRYDGTNWTAQTISTEQHLYSISFANRSNGWISGDSGLIFHYNGSEWLRDTTTTTQSLYTIYAVDSLFGFASGENGTLLQMVKPAPVSEAPLRRFCENGNTYFAFTSVPGYDYQWQVDSGNGFEDISDDNIYSGSLSDTLWLKTMPPSFYGNQYRCIVTYEGVDSIGNVDTLKFVNRWLGGYSNNWEDPANWSCGELPGENTDVIIDHGELLLHTEIRIRSLTVTPNVHITLTEEAQLHILK